MWVEWFLLIFWPIFVSLSLLFNWKLETDAATTYNLIIDADISFCKFYFMFSLFCAQYGFRNLQNKRETVQMECKKKTKCVCVFFFKSSNCRLWSSKFAMEVRKCKLYCECVGSLKNDRSTHFKVVTIRYMQVKILWHNKFITVFIVLRFFFLNYLMADSKIHI